MSSALQRRFLLPVLALLVSPIAALAIGELTIRLALPQPRLVIAVGGLSEPDPPGHAVASEELAHAREAAPAGSEAG